MHDHLGVYYSVRIIVFRDNVWTAQLLIICSSASAKASLGRLTVSSPITRSSRKSSSPLPSLSAYVSCICDYCCAPLTEPLHGQITVFRGRPITSPRPTPSPGPKGPVVIHDPTGPVVIHDPKGPVEDPKKQPHGPTNPHPSPKPEWTFKITFTQLLKQVSYVRRPYHAQAVALVSICYALYRTWTTTTTKTKEMFAAIEV